MISRNVAIVVFKAFVSSPANIGAVIPDPHVMIDNEGQVGDTP